MKKLLIIILVILPVMSYGQKNIIKAVVTITDSLKLSDTITVINLPSSPRADTATLAEKLTNQDTITVTTISSLDSIFSVEGRKESAYNLLYPPHGWARFSDSTVVLNITQNVYTQVTNTYDSLFRQIHIPGIQIVADTIVFETQGHYLFSGTITFTATINDVCRFRVMLNGTSLYSVRSSVSSTGEYHTIPLNLGIHANVDDELWIEVTNTSSSDDITIIGGSWYVLYIHALN